MRVVRALLIAVLLSAGMALAVLTVSPGSIGQLLSRWLSDQLQRPLVIDGPVSMRVGRTLQLSAAGIRLGNVAWGSRDQMLLVNRFSVEIDALSLFRRPVIVRRIEVDGLDLLLERRADGASNWEFAADSDDEKFVWPDSLPVVVDRVSLPGARIRFNGPRLDRPLDLHFHSLEQRSTAGRMLALAGRGTANDETIALDVTAGPFAAIVAGRDFTVAGQGRIGELDARLALRVDDLARPVDTKLDLDIRGPGAEYLTTRFGVRNLGAGPLLLKAVVRPSADGAGVAGEITGEIGQFTIRVRGELADPTQMRKLRAELDIAGPDLGFAGGLVGVDRLPAEPFHLTAAFARSGESLLIDAATLIVPGGRATMAGTINRFTSLTGNDLRFRVTGAELGRYREWLDLPATLSGAFDVSGDLKTSGAGQQARELLDLQITMQPGSIKLTGPLGAQPDYYATRLQFSAAGPGLAQVGALFGVKNLPAVDFAARGTFEWTAKGAVIRKGELRAGRDQLDLDGVIARNPLGPGTDFSWRLRGPNLQRPAAVLHIDGLPPAAFDLRGRLRRESRVSRLDDVQGTLAGADLRLSGRIADQPRLGTTVDLQLAGPRLEVFAGLLPDYELPAGKFRIAGGLALTPKRIRLDRMQISAAAAQGTLDADIALPLSATRGEFELTVKGKDIAQFLPRPAALRTAAVPFDLRVRGAAAGSAWRFDAAGLETPLGNITGSGQIDWAPDFSATALKLSARAANLAAVGQLLALKLPAQPFELTAALTGTPTAFRMDQATGRLGSTDFDGRLQLELGKRTVLAADFRSDLLDLTPFFDPPVPAAAVPAVAAGPIRRRSAARLIPDTPIPLAWLNRFDGSLTVQATRVLLPTVALDDLHLVVRLENGKLVLDELNMQAPPDGHLRMSGSIEPRAGGAAVRLSARGTRVHLAWLDDTPALRAVRPRAEISLDLAGEGATWRALAKSLEGQLRLTAGAGTLPLSGMNRLFGGLWQDLVASVMPTTDARNTTNVKCLAAFAGISGGVLKTSPTFVLQTDKVNVITHGTVDFATEQISFYLSTAPRRGRVDITMGEIVNPYMKVTGTLANPGLGVDPKGVLFSGGVAVATAGVSILAKSVWDRIFRADDPCAAAAAAAAKAVR